jgi:hypothetical protein
LYTSQYSTKRTSIAAALHATGHRQMSQRAQPWSTLRHLMV